MSTVLVTGADRGIAAALCQAFAGRGDRVFAACLGEESPVGPAGGSEIEAITGIDVTSGASVARLAEQVAGERIDILVNSAGVQIDSHLGAFDYEVLRREYDVNALGPLRVTEALLPSLHEGSRNH